MTSESLKYLPVQRLALLVAVVAATPYLILKLLWLSGSSIGMTSESGTSEMSGTRFFVGNVITVGLMLLAIGFLVALTRSWAVRTPAWVVFVLGAGATGLLAPILLGLPLGLVVQAVVSGDVAPGEQGLAPWVFAAVYTGFGVLAAAMVVIVAVHVLRRWSHLLTTPPLAPSGAVTVAGALGMLPFACAMAYWGIQGPGETGPQGMVLPAQRTVLIVTAGLSLAAFVTPLVSRRVRTWPRSAWLVTWTGCCVAALQGPAQILLAQGGAPQPFVVMIAALTTPGAGIYGIAALRRQLRPRGESLAVAERMGMSAVDSAPSR